ncbi:hypothetical protein EIP91_010745 [Steccherinum ochraceum]|uniref:SH3 domain-containing protein n=1 Tax=Steccherinum ochraceum TaxID=92696 RepID=A0A4R0RSI8_9APHY|nr:hypothetical protein EIP91_010745 [Steccherinum ochraceum]
MHNLHLKQPVDQAHKRLVKRQHRGGVVDGPDPLVPPGFTLTSVTVTQTVRLPETTLLETEVVTMAVPATSTPSPTHSSPSPPPPPSSSTGGTSATGPSSPVTPSNPPATSAPAAPSSPPVVQAPASSSSSPSTALAGSGATNTPASLDSSVMGASSKGISGGAIGGIVAAILIVAILIVLFLIRKMFLRKRQEKRRTWSTNIYPKTTPELPYSNEKTAVDDIPPPTPSKSEKAVSPTGNGALSSFPLPPPMSYNNPAPPSPSSASPTSPLSPVPVIQSPVPTLQPALGSPAVTLTSAPADTAKAAYAYVRCTFIPTLPDELSITTGEMVRVLGEFDDGWALCANTRGEQGVVPLECLDRTQMRQSVSGYMGEGTGDWRMSRRASSLYATSPQGAAAMRA